MTLMLEHRWPIRLPNYRRHQTFLGYAGEVDVWKVNDQKHGFLVVGPESRKVHEGMAYNFDGYALIDGVFESLETANDLHLTPYDMCLIYELLKEKGYLDG